MTNVILKGRRAAVLVREGCATDWEKCPHGEHARTVVRAGHSMTSCVHADDITEVVVEADEAPAS